MSFAIHRFRMQHTNGLLTGKYESQSVPGLGRHVRLVVPARDVVLKFLFLRYKRSLLFLQTVQLGEIQRIRMERGNELDGSQSHNEHRHEECNRP